MKKNNEKAKEKSGIRVTFIVMEPEEEEESKKPPETLAEEVPLTQLGFRHLRKEEEKRERDPCYETKQRQKAHISHHVFTQSNECYVAPSWPWNKNTI